MTIEITAPATTRPPVSDTIRAELRTGMERLHEQIQNGRASEEWALICVRDWRPDLSPWARLALWDEFTDAVDRLAEVRSDLFDPSQWDEDREVLEHRYDERAEAVITTLTGGRS